MRVLVADDDEAGLYFVVSVLESQGHTVVSASDGVTALEYARADPPDLLITDILMPRMDGYQLCREWKSDPLLRNIPVVFYTATYTEPADERFAGSIGADLFLRKPQEPKALLDEISRLMERHTTGEAETRRPETRREDEVLKEYSQRLVAKLETKVLDLKRSNRDLRRAMEVLSDEIEVKNTLIDQLNASSALRADLLTNLDAVVLAAPVAVVILDDVGNVTFWNPAAERVLGFSGDVAVGGPDPSVPAEGAKDRASLLERLRSGERVAAADVVLGRGDGSAGRFCLSGARFAGATGGTCGFVLFLQDREDPASSCAER